MSEWLVLTFAVLATCSVVLLVAVLRQRRQGEEDDPTETPDVIEYMTMMIGVVYAIVLGLAIAGVWEERSAADEWVRQEAQALHEMDQRAAVFAPERAAEIRSAVESYVAHVVGPEWDHMLDAGELTEEGEESLTELRATIAEREPTTVAEITAYQALLDEAAAVDEARAGRGQSAESTMPAVVWFGLLAGGAVTVGMLFTLQIQRSGRELLLAGLFSALITFLLFLIWYFDAPYARALGDSTEAFQNFFPGVAGGD
ncbi:bestrophin-like domain [Streptomyces triticirhizae]|uniref:DUF4239 domain-containing protein n=1 Tax=Streptomyces triticirhizae TaxID=2483353 RepID=A0A3M2M303_9ACTN|nr:DUF4239 domain-containing protein [Streptomyces triticirhizae]RMI44124.1 DUF4239 domain-containing protein [Streptomyces triticirhizae]